MKKIFNIFACFTILLGIHKHAYAYVDWYHAKVLWKSGLSNHRVFLQRPNNETSYENIVISGNDAPNITLDDPKIQTTISSQNTFVIPLLDLLPQRHSCRWWNISGKLNVHPFSLRGIICETDEDIPMLFRSPFPFCIIIGIIGVILMVFIYKNIHR